MLNDQLSKCWLRKSWKSRGDREIFSKFLKIERRKRNGSQIERRIFFKSWKSRGERETFPPILEDREENETWKLASREIWVISLREFLKIKTLVNVCCWIKLIILSGSWWRFSEHFDLQGICKCQDAQLQINSFICLVFVLISFAKSSFGGNNSMLPKK